MERTEWVDARAGSAPAEPDFTDQYGTEIDLGRIGVLIGGGDGGHVLIEGTREEVIALARSIETSAGQASTAQ